MKPSSIYLFIYLFNFKENDIKLNVHCLKDNNRNNINISIKINTRTAETPHWSFVVLVVIDKTSFFFLSTCRV